MKKGIIEGFYGIPWTFEERKSMIKFLPQIGMNQYIYAPKDDPFHNKKWGEPYPKDQLEKIKVLADLSKENGIDFTGPSIQVKIPLILINMKKKSKRFLPNMDPYWK